MSLESRNLNGERKDVLVCLRFYYLPRFPLCGRSVPSGSYSQSSIPVLYSLTLAVEDDRQVGLAKGGELYTNMQQG